MKRLLLFAGTAGLVLASCTPSRETARPATQPGTTAQARPPTPATGPPPGTVSAPTDSARTRPGAATAGRMKKYSDVITREAITDDGIIKTHRVGDKLYFEIPDSTMGRELLLVSRIARSRMPST